MWGRKDKEREVNRTEGKLIQKNERDSQASIYFLTDISAPAAIVFSDLNIFIACIFSMVQLPSHSLYTCVPVM